MTPEAYELGNDTDVKVVVRRPGYDTVRRSFTSWREANHYLTSMTKTPYPRGTVAVITDWDGTARYLLRGGGDSTVVMIRLSDKVYGLPSRFLPEPAVPELKFELPES